MAESKEELKRLLMKVKESEKAGLNLNVQKMKNMASGPITSRQIDGGKWKQWQTLFSWAPKSLQMVSAAMKLKDNCSLEEKLWQTFTAFLKQRYHFADKGTYSQSYGFSSSQVQMWELDNKEGWVPKLWWFWKCLRRVLRVPYMARRLNLSIIMEMNPEYSLEGPVLNLWYFGHLMLVANSLEKTLVLGKPESRSRRGRQRMRRCMATSIQYTGVWANSGRQWRTWQPGVLQSMRLQRVRHN